MAKKPNKTNPKNAASYFGGLNYKEFKKVGMRSIELNDAAWAGRLFSKYPYWWKRLSATVMVLMLLTVVCLAAIWGSVLLRPPALLLAVYPNGQVVCFPRLVNTKGQAAVLHTSYQNMCASLGRRAGMSWQNENMNASSSQEAVGNINAKVAYQNIADVVGRSQTTVPNPLAPPTSTTVPPSGAQP